MSWITDIAAKTQEIPIPGALKKRLNFKRRKHGGAEQDELLVKIDILTARNNELMQVANLDAAQQANEISEEEVKILLKIANENVESAREISDELEITLARAEYRLAQLQEHGYLVDFTTLNYHAYLLDRRGRDYLEERGLHRFEAHQYPDY
jgi:biotin operon repressor